MGPCHHHRVDRLPSRDGLSGVLIVEHDAFDERSDVDTGWLLGIAVSGSGIGVQEPPVPAAGEPLRARGGGACGAGA
jgi:hypothetical protein